MLAKKPLVSVIIPTFNRAAVLSRAIESSIAQTFEDIEIIIIDDGSTDNTQEVIDLHAAQFGCRLRHVYQDHHNAASARNKGIGLAQGKYLAFLDSDDAWHSDKLKLQYDYLEISSAAFVHTGRRLVAMPGNLRSNVQAHANTLARNSAELLSGNANVAMTVMIRQSVLDKVGLFDENLTTSEDLDLWLRVAMHYELGFIDKPMMTSYKMADSSMTANPRQTYRDRIAVFEKLLTSNHPQSIRENWMALLVKHTCQLSQAPVLPYCGV